MNFIKASEVFKMMNTSENQQYLFAVDFELNKGIFIKNPMEQKEVLWRVGAFSNFETQNESPTKLNFKPHSIAFSDYHHKFDIVKNGLHSGNSFLTNLTIRTNISSDYTLEQIARHANSPYVLMVPQEFVCFSPETFVHIHNNGEIGSRPMKGTIDATIDNALQKLTDDKKEREEHNTIVDLIRNDLSIIADGVRVERFRYAEWLKTMSGEIIQTSSLIRGNLTKEYSHRLGDVMKCLLPAGSVSGAPKEATLKLIRQAEKSNRGFYTGVFGYCDGNSIDSAVMIRFIEQNVHGQQYFRSGSGITANSDAQSEYDECIKKIYLPFERI